MSNQKDGHLEILIALLDLNPKSLNRSFLETSLNMSNFWHFIVSNELPSHWRKRISYNISLAHKYNNPYSPITHDGSITKRSLEEVHSGLLAFINRLRISLGAKKLIAITRKSIPGNWFVISDYANVTLVSVNDWNRSFSPPPIEIFLIKTIMAYTLLYSREGFSTSPYHNDTRGCIYDFCEDKTLIKATLWGRLCNDCVIKLRNWGVKQDLQDEALEMIRRANREIVNYSSAENRKVTVFISYARQDIDSARKLYNYLADIGFTVWLDEKSLLPGENWEERILQTIRRSRFFITLLSRHSISKKGYVQKELKLALDVLDEYPESDIYLIPVRLEVCEPNQHRINALNWVDMFPNWNNGFERIVKTLKTGLRDKNE